MMIKIYIMGKEYEVPEGLTIQKAMEHAGYKLLRGCGCRGGFCGACGAVYRVPGDHKLNVALACQTVIEPGMNFVQIPFFPANKAHYTLDELTAYVDTINGLYPEVMKCLQCNTCNKICPQQIDVMGYMACAMRGDIQTLARKSFDCLMCGLCAMRCPAELVQYNIALLGRRLYGKYMARPADHLRERVEQIEKGTYNDEFERLMQCSKEELMAMYEKGDKD